MVRLAGEAQVGTRSPVNGRRGPAGGSSESTPCMAAGHLVTSLKRVASDGVQPLLQAGRLLLADVDLEAVVSVGEPFDAGVAHPSELPCPPEDRLALLVVVCLPQPEIAVRLGDEAIELGLGHATKFTCDRHVAEADRRGYEVNRPGVRRLRSPVVP